MKPDASRVPFSPLSVFNAASLLREVTYQFTAPPTTNGTFNSKGINIPNAKAKAGILQRVKMIANTAPIPYNNQGAPTPLINGSITAAIAFACGAASAPLVNPYVLFKIIITPPTVAAETIVPRNFHVSCLAGVLPNQ